MNTFFSRYQRVVFSVVMMLVVVSMLFYGVGNKSLPQTNQVAEVYYKVGAGQQKQKISKRHLESLKIYLAYDMGYDFNDGIDRQNIFADGFLLNLIDSSFGEKLIDKFYPLVEKDFAKSIKHHRKTRMYAHPSGQFNLEDEIKVYAKDLYAGYLQVKDHEREVDAEFFKDFLHLAGTQKRFRPRDAKLLTKIFMRDKKLAEDRSIERRNFALFGARNNEEMFGRAFVELVAQVVIAGDAYAKELGYLTTYEEASGVITRRALDLLGSKYPEVADKGELVKLKDKYIRILGLQEDDLVRSACSIMNLEKMIKDVDATVLLDKVSVANLFNDTVDTLLVNMIQDPIKRKVESMEDALELHYYLSSVGRCDSFLSVPEAVYAKDQLHEEAKDLLVKRYKIKMSMVSKEQVGNSISLKKVWDFGVSDAGFTALCNRFGFDTNLAVEDRFAFLQELEKGKAAEVEAFSRTCLVENDAKLVAEALKKQKFQRVDFIYNKNVSTEQFGKTFNEHRFVALLDKMKEEEEVPCYSQDQNHFFRVFLWKKAEAEEVALLNDAKANGYTKALLDKKLTSLNKGKAVSEEQREALCYRLLRKEAGEKVAQAIREAEREGTCYTAHQEKRIKQYIDGVIADKEDALLQQFNLYQSKEIVARNGKKKELAKEPFFLLHVGEVSLVEHLNNEQPFVVELLGKKVDEERLSKYYKSVRHKLAVEAREALYDRLLSRIESKEMLVLSRFETEG